MIEPETKDWTWVLERPCADCGFDPSAQSVAEVPDLLRQNAMAWDELVREGVVVSGRPDPLRWSSLEYLCHLRDAFGHIDRRLALMVSEGDPVFPYWDQDTDAVENHYDDQEPGTVVVQLTVTAEALASRIGDLTESALARAGRRDDGVAFTVGSISLYALHEADHHLADVTN